MLEGQQRLVDEAESLGVSTERVQRQRAEMEEASRFEKQQLSREREAAEEQNRKLSAHLEKRKQALDEREARLEQFNQQECQARREQLDDAEAILADENGLNLSDGSRIELDEVLWVTGASAPGWLKE